MELIRKLFLLTMLVGVCLAITEPHVLRKGVRPYAYKTLWFNQKVDHFAFANSSYFKQRYLINDSYWEAKNGQSGPIFFYTGNEGDIEAFAQNSGFMWDIAPSFGALLVFAEHRYYGQSLPFGKKSLKPDPAVNGYLTSEQALADYAYLLTHLKTTLKRASNSPVIAFGGSYGGMLAGWFRVKYPHICDGAIAASAPIAQFTAPCDAFSRIVTADYTEASPKCTKAIRSSWGSIDKVAKDDVGKRWMSEQFAMCNPLKKAEDVKTLKAFLNGLWVNVAMMDYPYSTSFLMPLPGFPVTAVCRQIVSQNVEGETDPNRMNVKQIVAGASVYYNYTGETKCLNLKDSDQLGTEMWEYQTCTEMVMPICSDGVIDMFEKADWNFTAFKEYCQKKWKVTPQPSMANVMYGAKKLKAASNIVFSNGLLDPWSSGGVLRDINPSVVAILIPEGAHHLDLRGANIRDPTSVLKARKMERLLIRKWIAEAYKENRSSNRGPSMENFSL